MGAALTGQGPPPTDPTVSLMRYTNGERGRLWYDVAHFDQLFQPRFAQNVTAEYRVIGTDAAGTTPIIEVVNTEWLVDRPVSIRGVATPDPRYRGEPGKLLVQFDPSEYFPIVPGAAHYWILLVSPLDADHPDYRYAVVSNPARTALWILSATPHIDEADMRTILARLMSPEFGFSSVLFEKPNFVITTHMPSAK